MRLTRAAACEPFLQLDAVRAANHLKNIFAGGELVEKSNVQKRHFSHSDKPIEKR